MKLKKMRKQAMMNHGTNSKRRSNAMGTQQFEILAKAKIQDKRSIVISKHLTGELGFTMAQQLNVQDGPRIVPIFIKGAFHIDSLEGLYNLRDALNEAIRQEEDTF